MLYTHSHADHFGGARGIIDEAEIAAREQQLLQAQLDRRPSTILKEWAKPDPLPSDEDDASESESMTF